MTTSINYAVLDRNVCALFALESWLRTGIFPKPEAYALLRESTYYQALLWLKEPHRRSFEPLIPTYTGRAGSLEIGSLLAFYLSNKGRLDLTKAPSAYLEIFLNFFVKHFDLEYFTTQIDLPNPVILRDKDLYHTLQREVPHISVEMSKLQPSWPVAKTNLIRVGQETFTLDYVFENVIIEGSLIDKTTTIAELEKFSIPKKIQRKVFAEETRGVYLWLLKNWDNPSRSDWLQFLKTALQSHLATASPVFLKDLSYRLKEFNFTIADLPLPDTQAPCVLHNWFILLDMPAVDIIVAIEDSYFRWDICAGIANGNVAYLKSKLAAIVDAPTELAEGLVLAGLAPDLSHAQQLCKTCFTRITSFNAVTTYITLTHAAIPADVPIISELDM